MNHSVSDGTQRYMQNLKRRLCEKDELNALERVIVFGPRERLAWTVSGVGQRIMRLGRRIDESAPNGDEHEAWSRGVEVGRMVARRESEPVGAAS